MTFSFSTNVNIRVLIVEWCSVNCFFEKTSKFNRGPQTCVTAGVCVDAYVVVEKMSLSLSRECLRRNN